MQATLRIRLPVLHREEEDASMRFFMAKMPYNKETGNKVECDSIPYTAALVMLKMLHFIFVAGGPLDLQFRGLRIESSSIAAAVTAQKREREESTEDDAGGAAKRVKPDPDAAAAAAAVKPEDPDAAAAVVVKPDPDAAAAAVAVKPEDPDTPPSHLDIPSFERALDARLALFELDEETAVEVRQKAACVYSPGFLEAETFENAKNNVLAAVTERVRAEAVQLYTFHMNQWHEFDRRC